MVAAFGKINFKRPCRGAAAFVKSKSALSADIKGRTAIIITTYRRTARTRPSCLTSDRTIRSPLLRRFFFPLPPRVPLPLLAAPAIVNIFPGGGRARPRTGNRVPRGRNAAPPVTFVVSNRHAHLLPPPPSPSSVTSRDVICSRRRRRDT